jgi:hypothetical protein
MKTSATADVQETSACVDEIKVTSPDYNNGVIFKIIFKDYTRAR